MSGLLLFRRFKKSFYDRSLPQKEVEGDMATKLTWNQRNPERAAMIQKRWRDKNLDRVHTNVKNWQLSNPERVRENWKRWAAANPDRIRDIGAKARKRRAAKTSLEQREGRKEVRRLLALIKLERGCYDCGFRADASALDFDHVRGDKKKNLSRFNRIGPALIEIEKCDVRCSNCHRSRTFRSGQHFSNPT